jgi:hypothetical protein
MTPSPDSLTKTLRRHRNNKSEKGGLAGFSITGVVMSIEQCGELMVA